MYDVAILGAGIAGAAAAYQLRGANTVILEAEEFVGGRTYSEQFPHGLWANYGAGYFSADKINVIGLGDAVGVDFLLFDDKALSGDFLPDMFDADDIAEIRKIKRRLDEEKRRKRDPATPELDNVSFAQWLGSVRPNVAAYWQLWCSTMSAPMDQVSLYGMLLMTGTNRTAAFTDDVVKYDSRGNLVVKGGNGLIARKLIESSGAEIHTGWTVQNVAERDGAQVATSQDGSEIAARAIVSALPAPVVGEVFSQLPTWKRSALEKIRYGRIVGMPIVVGPAEGAYERFQCAAAHRPDAVYCETEFLVRSPTDLEREGAYFVCQVYDRASRVIWDDPDASIRAGAFAAFSRKFPHLAHRVMNVGLKRWRHGLPQYSLGRMAATPHLRQPVGGVFFCGDYTDLTHTDGAAVSGIRAAREAQDFLRARGSR